MAHGENIKDLRYAHQGLQMNHVTCGKNNNNSLTFISIMSRIAKPPLCLRKDISTLCAAPKGVGIASEYCGN